MALQVLVIAMVMAFAAMEVAAAILVACWLDGWLCCSSRASVGGWLVVALRLGSPLAAISPFAILTILCSTMCLGELPKTFLSASFIVLVVPMALISSVAVLR